MEASSNCIVTSSLKGEGEVFNTVEISLNSSPFVTDSKISSSTTVATTLHSVLTVN